ncbi:hypothetical protein ABXS75_13265 [Roseburia hominis]
MKKKLNMILCTIMLFVPWTILPLRTFDWALKTPVAQIMISCYAAFMIFSGVFTLLVYRKDDTKSKWLQLCTVVNGIYAVGGAAAFFLMFPNLL